MISPYTRIIYGGRTLNARTAAMLDIVSNKLGYDLTITQGSYNAGGVSASAGTHDGGGAVDLSSYDWERKVRLLRQVGFAAWYRAPIPGLWGAHIHAIAIGDQDLSSGARSQVSDYYNGRDGLAGNGPDRHWRPSPIPVFNYEKQADLDKEWNSGDVWLSKLKAGTKNSDSVRRLQFRLSKRDDVDMPNMAIDGNYGPQTVNAVKHFQVRTAEHGGNNGREVSDGQATRIFGKKYRLHEEKH